MAAVAVPRKRAFTGGLLGVRGVTHEGARPVPGARCRHRIGGIRGLAYAGPAACAACFTPSYKKLHDGARSPSALAVLAQLVVERAAAHIEQASCERLVAPGAIEGMQYRLLLGHAEPRGERRVGGRG